MVRRNPLAFRKSRRAGYRYTIAGHCQHGQLNCPWHPTTASELASNHPGARGDVEKPKSCCPTSESMRENASDLNDNPSARLLYK